MSFGEIITWPFAKLMVWLYGLTGNYGVALIFFALVVNLIMTPFMAKSKKSMMRSTRLQPMIAEIQRRHEGNPQKMNAEMQKLYREEGVNPMSGCLWSLIPFPILIALYSVVRQPITRMMFASKDVVTVLQEYFTAKGYEVAAAGGRAGAYAEIQLTDLAHKNWAAVQSELAGKVDGLLNINFDFLGMNMGEQPAVSTLWKGPYTWAAIGLFLIPFISAGLSWLSMKISTAMNPTNDANPQAAASMKSMNIMMPLMSVYICFVMPAAMGIYWIFNSVFGIIRDYILTVVFKKQLDVEDAERAERRSQREKEMEAKRAEYEKLKAEGKTEVNANTSKKKLQASEKQKSDERKAALERADRAARRERLGIKEAEKPASQVGNRRYARGRAYDPNRFAVPGAVEGESAIDEAVEAMEPAAAPESAAAEGFGAAEIAAEPVAGEAPETAEAVGEVADAADAGDQE